MLKPGGTHSKTPQPPNPPPHPPPPTTPPPPHPLTHAPHPQHVPSTFCENTSALPPGGGTVAEGAVVYLAQCAGCHGPTGTEGPNDRLVGTTPWEQWPSGRAIGNYWPYATTLFDYIRKAMPQLTPGTLTADETYAVIAYILNLNGLVPDDGVMNAETLPAVVMPARDKFVPDDRRGGAEVR